MFEPVRVSSPAAPFTCTATLLRVRPDRSALVPEAAFTTRVSVAPPATPFTVQAWPVICTPAKVPVRPLAMFTTWKLVKVAPVRSMEALSCRVLVPVPPSAVSPALTSPAAA